MTSNLKNHELVIDVAHFLKCNSTERYIFHIYGHIPIVDSHYYNRLIIKIKELNVEDNIIFKNFNIDQFRIYDDIHILFHPCSIESFGRIFIEAMSRGVPVVAVNGKAAQELIEDGTNGFIVQKDNYKVIGETIKNLTNKKNLYDQIAYNAFNYVKIKFSSKKIMTDLEALYNNLNGTNL